MVVPSDLIERLLGWRRIVVVGHVTPDADCLGAMLGIALGLAEPGRRVLRIALPEGSLSLRTTFMVAQAKPTVAVPGDFAAADGIVVVDTAKAPRCNVGPDVPANWAEGKTVINIDHHASNTQFGQINWIEPTASSASEMIALLLTAAGRPIGPELASLLYAGLLTDTAGFTLSNTSASALRTAGELVARGANVSELGERLYRSQTPAEFQLLQRIYANTRIIADGRIAYSTASFDEIAGAGCTAADIDDQVGVPRSVRGIRMALLLTEGIRGRTRINFRGESGLAVLELAKSMGGGGHAEAAGAILEMPLDQALPCVLEQAAKYVDAHGAG